MPVTPDYGGPVVCYADGVFDQRFNRYVTVREGMRSVSYMHLPSECLILKTRSLIFVQIFAKAVLIRLQLL